MKVVSESLVVIRRNADKGREVLVGTKKRGKFAGMTVFPGGKAEGSHAPETEAAREVEEEVGISLNPRSLRYAGKLLIQDWRPSSARFGNVLIYLADVHADTEASETDELQPRWESTANDDFIAEMPVDVALWWPHVRDFDGKPKITHVIHDEDGSLEIITKEPDFQNSPGKILAHQIQ